MNPEIFNHFFKTVKYLNSLPEISVVNSFEYISVVGDYINIMKTTFDFNFIYIKLLNMDTLKNMKTKKSCQLKKLIFINL